MQPAKNSFVLVKERALDSLCDRFVRQLLNYYFSTAAKQRDYRGVHLRRAHNTPQDTNSNPSLELQNLDKDAV